MSKHIFFAIFLIVGIGPLAYVLLGEQYGFSNLSQNDLVDYSILWVPLLGFTLWAWLYARKNPNDVKGTLKVGGFMAFVFLCGLFLFFRNVWPHL